MELHLDPNGESTKLVWRSDECPRSKPILLPKPLLLRRSQAVRADLNDLNDYFETSGLDASRDPSWVRYRELMIHLRESGRSLFSAIFNFKDSRAQELLDVLNALPDGAELKIFCSDDQVTLPFGYVFQSGQKFADAMAAAGRPTRADFDGFWLNRFKITTMIAGSGCKALVIDPASFKSLYALHALDLTDAYDYMGEDRDRLEKMLTTIDFRQGYYDWPGAERACDEVQGWSGVVFVFAHSDGDRLELATTEIDSLQFAEMLHRHRDEGQISLIILNCCLSATGGDNCSLLGSVAERGFCGLVGTEAKIANTHAIRCGTRIMWYLCAHGYPLGKAFDCMQSDIDLFPLNLFYTCYADRRFTLAAPFGHLMAA